ncbi:MAG: hypothetical protein IJO29_01375 [Oscillospiraceae bacterium]|nr:hypothetical protein [Oscillospiraceae bacterium]
MSELFNKMMTYIKNNKEAISLTATLLIGSCAAFLKFIGYIFERAKLNCLGIDNSAISIFDDNLIADVLMSILFSIFVLAIIFIPLPIILSKLRLIKKILVITLLYFVSSVLLFLLLNGNNRYNEHSFMFNFVLFTIMFHITILYPNLAIYNSIKLYENETINNCKLIKGVAVIAPIVTAALCVFVWHMSYNLTKNESRYRFIDDRYAIIYETKDSYYIADFNMWDGETQIKYLEHTTIGKTGVTYQWKNFEDIIRVQSN